MLFYRETAIFAKTDNYERLTLSHDMQTYRFTVNGLRHHDFAERLDELCRLAPGRRLTLCVEPDNPGEADAVIAYLGSRCVGYVRSGQRAEACALIRASRQEVLQGRVVGTDRQRRWLTVEMTAAHLTLPSQPDAGRSHLLSRWSFEGRTLPVDEAERRLHAMLASLQIVLESCEPWEDDVEEWLEYIERQLWRDISSETSAQVAHILRLLTDGTPRHPLYADKALRLQLAIERMGSPEVRRRQAQHIVELARSAHMDELLCHYGQRAGEALLSLPEELARLFLTDSELLMGRLWYLRLPRHQVRALRTLLAMLARLNDLSEGDCLEESADNTASADEGCGGNPVRIAKGCKTKLLVALNAMYRAGWFADNQNHPLTNRDKALNDILQRAFGEEKQTQIGCTIFPARDPDHTEKHRAAIEELLQHLPKDKE